VLQSFIDRGLWDEAWEEIGDTPLGTDGVDAPTIKHAQEHHFDYGNHHFIEYRNSKTEA
jgi:hypothetical protein